MFKIIPISLWNIHLFTSLNSRLEQQQNRFRYRYKYVPNSHQCKPFPVITHTRTVFPSIQQPVFCNFLNLHQDYKTCLLHQTTSLNHSHQSRWNKTGQSSPRRCLALLHPPPPQPLLHLLLHLLRPLSPAGPPVTSATMCTTPPPAS